MLMPVSSEFVALCKAQIMLLTQALGASISVVYLTQELVEGVQPQLVPIAAYPESLLERERQSGVMLLPDTAMIANSEPKLARDDVEPASNDSTPEPLKLQQLNLSDPPNSTTSASSNTSASRSGSLVEQRQLVLPLVFEESVFGLLVTRRDDRAWEGWEQAQVEEVARTLSLACVIDQRYQWGQREREQERILLHQQHDLMDNLLHQFRNSLTALQTFGKLILRRLAPGDRRHDLATSMTRETERLRDLAQQMEIALETGLVNRPRSLPAATADASLTDEEQLGEAILDPHPMPLLPSVGLLAGANPIPERCLIETVLAPLFASATPIAQDKNLTFHTYFQEDLPPIWANPKTLREALNNLIENAIKYTPPGGHIWVLAEAAEDSPFLEVSVSDTGVGIPPADLPHIFERSYRGIQAQGTIPGSGLGLAIARSLIEQSHGKIQVFSPALETKGRIPGDVVPPATRGTTFVVQLPIALEDQERVEA
ncbi:MAG: sensor histidine kinase [Leptolyngbyaceae cyanobacterium bins.302]|nr:sensor histidine kinase [Leptolyngbyaceae cyanobacterium bins.302]